ncbi:ribonuclease P protein component [candidate division WOR-3 bacterium]|nr:ribonuclease P protein component [candidate division WOR-3 bacterium]
MNTVRSENLPRSEILRGDRNIRAVLAAPPVSSGALMAHFIEEPRRRVAFFVPRTIGKAVVRNRCKRRMREIYRRMKRKFPEGKIIFRLKNEVNQVELGRSFSLCAQKLRGMGA